MENLGLTLIVIILFILFSNLALIPFNQGLWWDEAVYLGLGQAILSGRYSLDPGYPLETFRPPLLPLVISVFSDSVLAARIFVWTMSVLSILAIFLFSKKLFGKRAALWAALFASTSYLFIFFSTKVLSEPLFIALLSLSLLFYVRWQKEGKNRNLFLAGLLSGMAFLTRYLGNLLILGILVHFAWLCVRKRRLPQIVVPISGILVILIPWFLLGLFYYGNPFGAFFENMAITFSVQNMSVLDALWTLLEVWAVMVPFVAVGFYFLIKKDCELIVLIFLISVIAWFVFPYKEPRYLLSFLPIFAAITGFGMEKSCILFKKYRTLIIFSVLFISIIISTLALSAVWSDRFAAAGVVQAGIWLKNITNSDEKIMTESYPYIYYLAQRKAVAFPKNSSEVLPLIGRENVGYILVYKFEPGNPEWVYGYFDSEQFEKIRSFEQWGDAEAITIYKLSY